MSEFIFDVNDWLDRIPLEAQPFGDELRYSGFIATSPFHISQTEHLRKRLSDQFDWGSPMGTDVFVMAKGEPSQRHITKIGGVPYWPSDRAWPRNGEDEPLVFIGQFWFGESKDLTGDLPGEVLSVFAELNQMENGGMTSEEHAEVDFESLHLEWFPKGISSLISPTDVPGTPSTLLPCYGYRFRAKNFPNAQFKNVNVEDPLVDGLVVDDAWLIPRYQATQIGHGAFCIQAEPDLPGKPLCTLSSVQAAAGVRYPWVNQEEPLDQFDFGTGYLKIQDMGCIYISIDEEGGLHYEVQSY